MIREFLQHNILITDGATGTYFSELGGIDCCEMANIENPQLVQQLHREYIDAGAKLIRTNTFSANTVLLQTNRQTLKQILIAAVRNVLIADSDKKCFIAANIGPIPINDDTRQNIVEEYHFIIDTFLDEGLTIFNFETFGSIEIPMELAQYIKNKNAEAFIIAQATLNSDGFTRTGIDYRKIYQQMAQCPNFDAFGFNCGIGPAHLGKLFDKLEIGENIVSALPNAGYPEIINSRTVYNNNPDYFAETMLRIKSKGVKILGGCCGTTPKHIAALTKTISSNIAIINSRQTATIESGIPTTAKKIQPNIFREKLAQGKFTLIAELDPPFNIDVDKFLNGVRDYRESEIDVVTVADSPMAKPRLDSVMLAAKAKRELEMETLPHLCCRDKNLNAIKSSVLAGYVEGIRNILAVTGDALPHDSSNIKSVFNVNSVGLISFLREMNETFFSEDPIYIGAALNPNVPNKKYLLEHIEKKINAGADFFLTQPVFEEESIEFLKQLRTLIPAKIKILGGILPIVSYNNALFLQNELPGVTVPDAIVNSFSPEMSRESAEEMGKKIAGELALKLKAYVDGIYFMTPFNRTGMIRSIIKNLS